MVRELILPAARHADSLVRPDEPSTDSRPRESATGSWLAQTNPDSVRLRPAAPADIEAIVAVHRAAFRGFFLSTLGSGFLRQMYRTFVTEADGICILAERRAGNRPEI